MLKMLRKLKPDQKASAPEPVRHEVNLVLQVIQGVKQFRAIPDTETIWSRFSFDRIGAILLGVADNLTSLEQGHDESAYQFILRRFNLIWDLDVTLKTFEVWYKEIDMNKKAFPYDNRQLRRLHTAVRHEFVTQSGIDDGSLDRALRVRSDDPRVSSRAFLQWLTLFGSQSSVWLRASAIDIARWQAVFILAHLIYQVDLTKRCACESCPPPEILAHLPEWRAVSDRQTSMCAMQLRSIVTDWETSSADAARLSCAIEKKIISAVLELVIASKQAYPILHGRRCTAWKQ